MNRSSRALIVFAFAVSASAQTPNQIVSGGYGATGYPHVAPGQVITLFVQGISVSDAVASELPLAASLNGLTVSVKAPSYAAPDYPKLLPIFKIHNDNPCGHIGPAVPCVGTQVTVQIPTEAVCVSASLNGCSFAYPSIILNVHANGIDGPDFVFNVLGGTSSIHFLTCDSVTGLNHCSSVTHADGSPVTTNAPARSGETIVVYAVGLGDTHPQIKTGFPALVPAAAATVPELFVSHRLQSVQARVDLLVPVPDSVLPKFAGLVSGYVGLYQLNFVVPPLPPDAVPCARGSDVSQPNTRFSIPDSHGNLNEFFEVCVQQP